MRADEIRIFPDVQALYRCASEEIVSMALKAQGAFHIALSGGSTPRGLYERLALEEAMPWAKVHLFLGDERHVSLDDPDSNFRMVRESLVERISIPEENVHPIPAGDPDAEAVARAYEDELRSVFGFSEGKVPRFDLVLLGMGPDGHTASLFPGSDALFETDRLVAAPWVEKLEVHRITLTPPLLNNAACLLVLVTGTEKAATLKAVLEGDHLPHRLPSQILAPRDGRLQWLIDHEAAVLLDSGDSHLNP